MSGTSSLLESLQKLEQKSAEYTKALDSVDLQIKDTEKRLRDLNIKSSYSTSVPLFRGNHQGELSLVWGEWNDTWKLLCEFRQYDEVSSNAYSQAYADCIDVGMPPPDEADYMPPPEIKPLLGHKLDFRICASHVLPDLVDFIVEEHFRIAPKSIGELLDEIPF